MSRASFSTGVPTLVLSIDRDGSRADAGELADCTAGIAPDTAHARVDGARIR